MKSSLDVISSVRKSSFSTSFLLSLWSLGKSFGTPFSQVVISLRSISCLVLHLFSFSGVGLFRKEHMVSFLACHWFFFLFLYFSLKEPTLASVACHLNSLAMLVLSGSHSPPTVVQNQLIFPWVIRILFFLPYFTAVHPSSFKASGFSSNPWPPDCGSSPCPSKCNVDFVFSSWSSTYSSSETVTLPRKRVQRGTSLAWHCRGSPFSPCIPSKEISMESVESQEMREHLKKSE